jgi:predicted nucleic acid-binding protein
VPHRAPGVDGVIHLDTNFLIGALVPGSDEDKKLRRWFRSKDTVRISSIVWAEFLCGPVADTVAEQVAELLGEPLPLDGADATVAAQLFNAAARRRGSLLDCMVAAIAIRDGAALATRNVSDFRRFADAGLMLV